MSSKALITITIAALVSVSLVFLLTSDDSSGAVGDQFTVGDLRYEVTSVSPNQEVKVIGFSGETVENLVIPPTVTYSTTYNVTGIGTSAFAAKGVRTANLGNVKDIGALAFSGCVLLTEVSGAQVTDIGESSFSGCILLETFTGDNLKVIGLSAFNGCVKLETINLENVTRIWDFAFMECRALESVDISKMIYIGSYAFYDSGLTAVSLPMTTIQIGGSAFNKCSNLESITAPFLSRYKIVDGALVDRVLNSLITMPQRYDIAGGNYTVPDDIEVIEDGAFDGCDKLKTVVIPASVETIGDGIFRNCPNLTTVTVSGGTYFKADGNCLYSYDMTLLYFVPQGYSGQYMAPAALTTVKAYAFDDCANITAVNIANVTNIGKYAFTDCYALKTIYVNKDATIGAMAFDLGSLGKEVECDIRSTGVDFITIAQRNAFTTINYYLPVAIQMVEPPQGAPPSSTEYVIKDGSLNLAPIKAELARFGYETYLDDVLFDGNSVPVTTAPRTVSFHFDGTAMYTLTFDMDGGMPQIAPMEINAGDAVPSIVILPTKEGYEFVSWSPAIPAVMPREDLTIKAVWIRLVTVADVVTDGNMKKITVSDGSVKIPKDVVDALAAGSENVQMNINGVSIKMPTDSFKTLSGTGDLTVSLDKSTGITNAKVLEKLSDAKKKIAEKASVVDIKFGTKGSVADLGAVTISVPYTVPSGQSADKLVAYYVSDDGSLDKMASSYSGSTVDIESTHFSTFAICSESLTEGPGSGISIGLIVGIAVGAVVVIGVVVFLIKKH